jgi:ATP-dependent phosphofructokinase / diphosphate-dependent phosphofructokinase
MRIGILNSGGDCPGLNAVIHGVVSAAGKLGWEVVGFRDGFEGLLPPGDYMMLDASKTIGIMKLGGTILGTTNKGHFVAKVGDGKTTVVPADVLEKAKATLRHLEIGALIVVGGDGSMTTALQLFREGIPVIGVPKTIDNDLAATAMTSTVCTLRPRATSASWCSRSWAATPAGSPFTAALVAEPTSS